MGFEQSFQYARNESVTSEKKSEKKEKPLSNFEKQTQLMQKMALEINASVLAEYGMKQLVLPDMHIAPKNFALENGHGGLYPKAELIKDKELLYQNDRRRSGSFEATTQERYGTKNEEEIVAHFKKEREMQASNQTEMVITALLHKMLKEKYLVVRAAEFDDIVHGIDNLILDKETGAIICAFDEMMEGAYDAGGISPKIAKIQEKANQGGAEAKYGVSLQVPEGILKRDHLRHIPVFFLNLKKADIQALTDSLFAHFDSDATDLENKIFSHLVASIEEQKSMLIDLLTENIEKKESTGGNLKTLMLMHKKLHDVDMYGLKSFCKV